MSGFKDIHNDPKANTAGFRQNPQNIGNGRHKKIYTILKEKGYSKDDIETAFKELAFYNEKEIESIHDDENNPVIVRIIAKEYYLALEDGDWNKIKDIIEHIIGKATQKIESKNVNLNSEVDNMTDEEVDKEINRLTNEK